MDPVPERRDLAQRLEASVVLDAAEDNVVEAIRDPTEGEGAEAAADFSGNPQARNWALDSVRIWGRVAFVREGNPTTITPSPRCQTSKSPWWARESFGCGS